MPKRKGYIITDPYGTYFITCTVVGWIDLFTRKACKDILIDSFKYCQLHKGLIIHAFVIMSSHIHMIVTAKGETHGISAILRDMKKHTSKQILNWVLESRKESRKDWLQVVFEYHAKFNKNNNKFQVWQQNNHPKICLHPRFTNRKLNYIHYNPVASGIVDKPEEYLYSSARNYCGRDDYLIEVQVIDFGVREGYVMT